MTIHYQFCTWQQHQHALMSIRQAVFIEEQNVPKDIEIDEHDPICLHILAYDKDLPVATARLLNDGHIGRMCVLKSYRLQGIATELLNRLIQKARQRSIQSIELHAQLTALPFYQKAGFVVCSVTFMDAGIKHKTMRLEQPSQPSLGNNPLTLELDSRVLCSETIISLISQATRSIAIFSQNLEYTLYHHSKVSEAIKTLIRRNRKAQVRIICKDSRSASQHGHCLINLAQRFSTFIEIRKPNTKEINQFQQSWLIIDDVGFCHIKNIERFVGTASFNQPLAVKESLDYFNHAWENSEIDQQTRPLSL